MKASILYEMITKKRNPWTQTLVTYRFVNASLHVYITITIKEQNEVVVVVVNHFMSLQHRNIELGGIFTNFRTGLTLINNSNF